MYCAWVAGHLGPVTERPLGEDIALLGPRLQDDPGFASLQALAWVFHSGGSAEAAVDGALGEVRVDDEPARRLALDAGDAAELLRAAAELEMPLLPSVALDRGPFEARLERVIAAAPALEGCSVAITPALPRRGRVLGRRIFVGLPGIAGAEMEHLAWQAAHEATVTSLPSHLAYADVERLALGLLRTRARRVGLGDEHARWFARLDVSALGPIPDVEDPL